MIYGGTIRKGFSKLLGKDINVSTCYEAAGAYTYGKLHAASGAGDNGRTPSDVMVRISHEYLVLLLISHRMI
jgi:dihydroxy-acid dehydratase